MKTNVYVYTRTSFKDKKLRNTALFSYLQAFSRHHRSIKLGEAKYVKNDNFRYSTAKYVHVGTRTTFTAENNHNHSSYFIYTSGVSLTLLVRGQERKKISKMIIFETRRESMFKFALEGILQLNTISSTALISYLQVLFR